MNKSLAVIGATGLVGRVVLNVLKERNLFFDNFYPAASQQSVGKTVKYFDKDVTVLSVDDVLKLKPDFAIFSAGKEVSLLYAPLFAANNTVVIDNSSAWRMNENVPLIVPEINMYAAENSKLIANPNCSTIQMVLAISRLHVSYKIKRIVVSTYQSVTGSGQKGINQLNNERNNIISSQPSAYPHHIDLNVIPHGGAFLNDGYTEEEMKLVNETHKILNDNSINITATVVRVPVTGGHSESVNLEFYNSFELNDVFSLLSSTPGVSLLDNPSQNLYPMPLLAEGKDDVFVGRIRRDFSLPNSLNMWIVSDNLRKGAATNAVQILESLLSK